MKKINTLLAASALAFVSAQASAVIVPVTMTGTGVTFNESYLGFPVNGSSTLTGAGTYDTDTGITNLTFNMQQTNVDPFYSAGVLSIDGELTLDDGSVSGTASGSTTALACSVVSGNDTCGYVGVGDGPKAFDTVVSTGVNSVETKLTDAVTGTLVTQNLTVTPSAVPVPAAAWLFGSALVGLAGVGRKRKAA